MGHGDVVTDVLGRFDGIVVPGRTTEATAAVGESPLDAVVRPLPTTRRGTPWWVRAYRSAAVTTDVVFAGAAAWVCTSLRFNDEAGEAWNTAVTVAVTFLGWVVVLTFAHGYERPRFGSGTEEYRAVGLADGAPLRRLGWALAEREVELIVAPGIIDVAGPRLSLRPAAGLSLLHVERPVMRGGRVVVKRVVNTIAATAITVLALLPLAVIALLVRLDTAGPVFFRQERAGAKGTTFPMLKFRKMVLDAEDRLCDLASEPQVNEKLFKLPNDPRVTRVGAVLRRFSLDELPQLMNVLLGHMSVVGPRPPLPREVATYEPDAVQRLRVRPGMTGLWQISGRSRLSWEDALRLDLWYVDNWSPRLDAHILMRTTRAVLGGRGAY